MPKKNWNGKPEGNDPPGRSGAALEQFKPAVAGEIDKYALEKRFIRMDGSLSTLPPQPGHGVIVRTPDRSVSFLIVSVEV
jgi:hypothetical protein